MARVSEHDIDLGPMQEALSGPRSPGLHLSAVLRDLQNTITLKGQRRGDSELSPAERRVLGNYREGGIIWELAYERIFASRLASYKGWVAQEPLVVEGIHMTPDWMDIVLWILKETKATWKSMGRSANIQEEFWEWSAQMKAYARALGTRRADLIVLWMNGDYRGSGPKPKLYEFEYSQRELDMNWTMILKHRDRMVKAGRT